MLDDKQVTKIKKDVEKKKDQMYRVFGALGDANRLKIFRVLMKHDEICVTDLASILGISMPAVSQHLRVLELTNLVTKQRYGQTICYHVNEDDLDAKALSKLLS